MTNVVWQQFDVNDRRKGGLGKFQPCLLWLTGLPGSGKSTISGAIALELDKSNYSTFVLDGDNLRHGLCSDLGFSELDRRESVRRASEVSKLLVQSGNIVLASFISPYEVDRRRVKTTLAPYRFVEIYCDTPLEVCEARDPKGLYALARAGKLRDFTGVNAPYEPPAKPDIRLLTGEHSIEDCTRAVVSYLTEKQLIR